MMRTVVLFCLTASLVNSAILDNKSKKGEWDDEDSMILSPSTTTVITSNDITSITTNEKSNDSSTTTEIPTTEEDLITGEQNRPRFISLIPAGTHKVNGNTLPSKSDQEEDQDKMKYQIYSETTPKIEEDYATSSSSSDDNGGDSSTTPPSSSSSSEEVDDLSASTAEAQGTTARPPKPQLKHITLGKIPLTYQIIPLLPPREEKQQLLGREDTTPIGFFPSELEGSTLPHEENYITDKAKREQLPVTTTTTASSESEGEGEIITGKPVPELEELPPQPLTYMIPPQREADGETTLIWNLYPMTTTDTDPDLRSPQSTINPLLERINDFIMKVKRHSLETETTTTNADTPSTTTTTSTEENDLNTEKMETTTSTEQNADDDDSSSNDISTTTLLTDNHPFAISDTPEDSNGDLNPSSPVPIPEEPTEPIYTTSNQPLPTTTIFYPNPNTPEIQDYYEPESLQESPITYFTPPPPPIPPQQPITTPENLIHLHSSSPSPDQYYSDYNNLNSLSLQQAEPQPPLNPFYYNNPSSPSSSSAASLLRRRLMIAAILNKLATTSTTTQPTPPSSPIYIPNDSYWPTKYFNNPANPMMPSNKMFVPPASDYNTNYQPNYQSNLQPNYQSTQQPYYQSNQQPMYQSTQQPYYQPNLQPNYQSTQQPYYQSNQRTNYQSNQQPNYQSNQQPNYQSNQQPSYQSNPTNYQFNQPNYQSNQPNYQSNPTSYQSNNYKTNYNPYNTNTRGMSQNTNYYPQSQQNSYVFPQQQQTTAIPLQAALNVIAASSEEPSYSPYRGSFGGGVDDYSPSMPASLPSGGGGVARGSPYNSNPYYSPSSSSSQFRRSSGSGIGDGYNNFVDDNYFSSASYYPTTHRQGGSAYDVTIPQLFRTGLISIRSLRPSWLID